MTETKRIKEEQRKSIMSRIKSNNTKIETAFRKALWHKGIRYRKNYKQLPGKPDIVITKHKIAIFCDGEFWHGRDWETKKSRIQDNREYWISKIERNMERDREINQLLVANGWEVLRFWGNEINKDIDACVDEVITAVIQARIDTIT